MPLDIKQLNATYDPDDKEGDKKKTDAVKASPSQGGFDASQLSAEDPGGMQIGTEAGINYDEYAGYAPYGVYPNRNKSVDIQRGENQSIAAKIGIRMGNIIPNIAAGVLENLGYAGALLSEFGDERNYQNVATELANKMKNPFGEVYARTNQNTLGSTLADPAWWIDQFGNTVETAIGFAGVGYGAGMGFNAMARGATELFQLGATGARVAGAAGQLASAGLLAYMEGAQNGAQVYEEVYNNQLQKNIAKGDSWEVAHEKAKHLGAQSAATTVQLSTLLGTGLNMFSVAPYFRTEQNVAEDVLASQLGKRVGESADDWATRVRNFQPKVRELIHNEGLVGKSIGAFNEGLEEFGQLWAQKTGEDLGYNGKEKGFVDQLGEVSHLFDRAANKDGLLSFAIGAVVGAGQEFVTHSVLPSKYVTKMDAQGNPLNIQLTNPDGSPKTDNGVPVFQKAFYTPRTYDSLMTMRHFGEMKEAMAKDMDWFGDRQIDFLDAKDAGDQISMDKARDEMFNVGNLYAVRRGFADHWAEQYKSIGETDNTNVDEQGQTAAMKRGYASSPEDNEYKERAKEAIADIKLYKNQYDKLLAKYGAQYEANQGQRQVIDMMFTRQVDLHSWNKAIKKSEQKLSEMRLAEKNVMNIEPGMENGPDWATIAGRVSTGKYSERYNALTTSAQSLEADHKALTEALEAGDDAAVARLVRKYRGIGIVPGDLNSAAKDISEKINRKHQQVQNELVKNEQELLATSEYNKWKEDEANKDKSFPEYVQWFRDRANAQAETEALAASIEKAKNEYAIAYDNYQEVIGTKNYNKFAKKADDFFQQMAEEQQRAENDAAKEMTARAKDLAAFNRAQRIRNNFAANTYLKQRDAHMNIILQHQQEIADLKSEIARTNRDPVRMGGLRGRLRALQTQVVNLQEKVDRYTRLFEETTVDPTSQDEEFTDEDLTQQNDDLTEDSAISDEHDDTDNVIVVPDNTSTTPEVVDEDVIDITEEDHPSVEEVENSTATAKLAEDMAKAFTEFSGAKEKQSSQKLLSFLSEAEDKIYAGQMAFSWDMLKPFILDGTLTTDQAANILNLFDNYIRATEALDAATGMPSQVIRLDPGEVLEEPSDEDPKIDIPEQDDTEADSPVIAFPDEDVMFTFNEDEAIYPATHAGPKTVEAATTMANTTFNKVNDVYDRKTNQWVKTTDNTLNPKLNQDTLKGDKLMPNHPIRFEVDTEYDGEATNYQSVALDEQGNNVKGQETFGDYATKDGKVKNGANFIDNVPIRIVDAMNGKVLGYVRTANWLNQKASQNTTDRRNVEEVLFTSKGEEIDNLALQQQKLHALRNEIVNNFNKYGKSTDGHTTDKGYGMFIRNKEQGKSIGKDKIKADWASTLLPAKDIEIGIVHNPRGDGSDATIYTRYKYEFTKPKGYFNSDIRLPHGSVVAMLPGANGTFSFTPIIGEKLATDKKQTAVNTVAKAIELFLQVHDVGKPDPKVYEDIKKLQDITGFNIQTELGLSSFINQYFTYTKSFREADLALKPFEEGKDPDPQLFQINVWNQIGNQSRGNIKIGWTNSGQPSLNAKLVDGVLDSSFFKELSRGFTTRARAVNFVNNSLNLRGINESNPSVFNDVQWTAKGWRKKEYSSYNEYVKSFSKTTVDGRNTLDDGSHVYTANPSISFRLGTPPNTADVSPNTSTTETQVPHQEGDQVQDDWDSWQNFSLTVQAPTIQSNEIGTGDEATKEVNMQNLQELYNFTPEAQRNGRTVEEVFNSLQRNGNTFLAEGYNPFTRCL